MAHTQKRARSPRRRGFTLIECLMAILLIDVGLFALMGGTIFVARSSVAASARAAAATAARDRVDSLAIAACADTIARAGRASLTGGAQGSESWSRTPAIDGTVALRDSVAFAIWGAPGALVLSTATWC